MRKPKQTPPAPPSKSQVFIPRSRNRFRKGELARAVRAAKDAGAESVKLDPSTGVITIEVGGKTTETSDVESWLNKQKGP
jgi:hypothetical protein